MDWINCNLCCRQPDERGRHFTLSSCGHIFCDLCLAKEGSREKCGACSSECQLMQLSSKMKPEAEVFFQEPAALIKKHFTLITRLLDFQKDHRIRLVSFHRKIVQKQREQEKEIAAYKSREEKYNAADARIQELECEVQRLRNVVSTMKHAAGSVSSVNIHGKPSPKFSPGDSMISPGRLTMVKKNHGPAGGSRSIPNISPTAPYAPPQSTTTTRSKAFSPVTCQYFTPQHQQQPRHTEGLHHPAPGVPKLKKKAPMYPPSVAGSSYFRSISPAVPSSSPISRYMHGAQTHVSTPSSRGFSPGFQPYVRPLQPHAQPHTPLSYPSPDPYGRQLSDLQGYKKYTI